MYVRFWMIRIRPCNEDVELFRNFSTRLQLELNFYTEFIMQKRLKVRVTACIVVKTIVLVDRIDKVQWTLHINSLL